MSAALHTGAPGLLWRISNHADLLGTGGLRASARWHFAGRPVVYLAESPSAALLEVLVHLEVDEMHRPASFQLLKVEAEPEIAWEAVDPETLSPDWAADELMTQRKGDAWLAAAATALLRVPSAIVPETWNWLLNPRHSEAARVRLLSARRNPFDPRLF